MAEQRIIDKAINEWQTIVGLYQDRKTAFRTLAVTVNTTYYSDKNTVYLNAKRVIDGQKYRI